MDVTTHLVDLVQWEAFPEQIVSATDVEILRARRWTTPVTREQFRQVTGADGFPEFLQRDVTNGVLQVYANGEISYRLKGVHAKVSVIWNFEAPTGTGDTHYSIMRGTKANLVIRQGVAQKFKPVLYIESAGVTTDTSLAANAKRVVESVARKYPGVSVESDGITWRVTVPEKYHNGHEAHFAQVTENYLRYLREGKLPDWEVPNMIAKYATIMKAYKLSR